jgi:hypothetical protein
VAEPARADVEPEPVIQAVEELDRPDDESADDLTDAVIESLAVDNVCRYARAALEVAEIHDVQAEKKGWDPSSCFRTRPSSSSR